MTLVADDKGVVNGAFDIPSGIPAGTKAVTMNGDAGSRGETTYTGSTQIQTIFRRRVTSVTTQRPDPLAQTFTLESTRTIAAVDVWLKTKGIGILRCQIRETTTGIPNQEIIAEAELSAEELNLAPTATQFSFIPVILEAGREYALVFLTDDPDHALAIAELGKYSASTAQWQTRQPYQIGVLLSSSNASTWTPHQEIDLRFRLYAAKFTKDELVVNLGNVPLNNASVLLSLAGVERPNAETDVQFIVSDNGGNSYTAQENQPLDLNKLLTEHVNVKARLIGNNELSPVLYAGAQLISGVQAESGTYVTRAFPGGNSINVNVVFEANLPSGSNVQVECEIDGVWTALSKNSVNPVGDDFLEQSYSVDSVNSAQVRVRLTLFGTAAARPRVRNFRAVTT